MTIRALILASALLAPFMTAQRADALDVQIPATTTVTYIGMVNGNAWAAYLRPAGCLWKKLGDGGLVETTDIDGTSVSERIYALMSSTTVCNAWMTPLVTNGELLSVNGAGGDDIIVGGTKISWLSGGSGHDILISDGDPSERVHMWGGTGNDYLISSDIGAHMEGEGDNDRLCASPPNGYLALDADGGGGTDRICGPFLHKTSIEHDNTNCPADCALF
jgi:hypothetical protein